MGRTCHDRSLDRLQIYGRGVSGSVKSGNERRACHDSGVKEANMGFSWQDDVQAKPQYKPVPERDFVSHAQILEYAPEKIRNSANAGFYVDAIRAGWSMQQLSDYALKYFGETISRESFRRLRGEMSPDEIIDPTYRQTILRDIDAKIDVLAELQNLIAVQQYRVTKAVEFERQLASGQGKGVIPLKATRDEIELLYQMLKDLANVQIGIGIFSPGNARSGIVGINEENGVVKASVIETKIMELRKALTPEQMDRFIAMSEELQASLYALSVDVVDEHIIGVTELVGVKA